MPRRAAMEAHLVVAAASPPPPRGARAAPGGSRGVGGGGSGTAAGLGPWLPEGVAGGGRRQPPARVLRVAALPFAGAVAEQKPGKFYCGVALVSR